jgi:hypothetical protein
MKCPNRVAFANPTPALVIRYSYLWRREHLLGQEEGLKDRPCAVVMTVQNKEGRDIVTVLPVTHSPPQTPGDAIEIPADTKRRLGLDDSPSWVVLTEANRFVWPGPDLRPGVNGDPSSIAYGSLPEKLFERIRLGFLAKTRATQAPLVSRTE